MPIDQARAVSPDERGFAVKLIAYVRVSTEGQARDGYGLESQRWAIREWARAVGHQIVAWHTDAGVSGALDAAARPGLTEALAALAASMASGLVVRDLDRIARTLTTQEAILATVWAVRGNSVFTCAGEVLADDPDDPMRRAMRQMAGVFAELERAQLTRRMRDGRRAKAASGGFAFGSPPYGWRAEGRELVPEPGEQRVLRLILRQARAGASTRVIAAELNAAGHTTKRGRAWTSGAVSTVLTRQRADGRRTRAA